MQSYQEKLPECTDIKKEYLNIQVLEEYLHFRLKRSESSIFEVKIEKRAQYIITTDLCIKKSVE